MNESDHNEQAARAAWRSQSLDAPQLSVQFVRHQAERLDWDRRREIRIAWGALAACLLLTAVAILNPHGGLVNAMTQTLRLTSVLLLLGCAYLLYQLRQRSRSVSGQADGVVGSLSAYRCELLKRRDLYRHSWRWSIWPILPALLAIFVGGGLFDDRPGKLGRYGLCALVAVIGSAVGIFHYRRKADQFQRELDALASMDEK